MKNLLTFLILGFFLPFYGQQNEYKFYIDVIDYNNPPGFQDVDGKLIYIGDDLQLKDFLST